MYKFDIIAVGKQPAGYLTEGCEEFLKRLSPYAAVSVTEIPHSRLSNESPADIEAALLSEQSKIMQAIPKNAEIIALCIEGRGLTTEQLSDYISRRAGEGVSRFAFIIGGSHGLAPGVKSAANLRLSMSGMTFPHALARVMLLEQLYRVTSIQNNGKYHK